MGKKEAARGRKVFAVDIDGTITENGGGRIHLGAMSALRRLEECGHTVIFVTGRSSVEGFVLSVFGGTTNIAVGENGGCITDGPDSHILIGDRAECETAFDAIRQEIPSAHRKPVFPRMTEVVLERTFEVDRAARVLERRGMSAKLSDSQYAYHINSPGGRQGDWVQARGGDAVRVKGRRNCHRGQRHRRPAVRGGRHEHSACKRV